MYEPSLSGALRIWEDYSRTGKVGIETLYLGKRPNFFRIYNKIAEFHYQMPD